MFLNLGGEMKKFVKTALFSALVFPCIAVFAQEEQKAFEFGPGTANPTAAAIKFFAPCHIDIFTDIIFRRAGETGSTYDLPIVIEYRQPGSSATSEGTLVRRVNITATRTQQKTTTYGLPGAAAGCTVPWTVIAKAASGAAPLAIFGSIRMSPYIHIPTVEIEGGLISLAKGNWVTKKFGTSAGFPQSVIEIDGGWFHSLLGIPGPLPVRLKFELLKPDGSVAASASGYTKFEINPCCSNNKLLVKYLVKVHLSGQWKLRITNNSNDDVMNIDPRGRFWGACTL